MIRRIDQFLTLPVHREVFKCIGQHRIVKRIRQCADGKRVVEVNRTEHGLQEAVHLTVRILRCDADNAVHPPGQLIRCSIPDHIRNALLQRIEYIGLRFGIRGDLIACISRIGYGLGAGAVKHHDVVKPEQFGKLPQFIGIAPLRVIGKICGNHLRILH